MEMYGFVEILKIMNMWHLRKFWWKAIKKERTKLLKINIY